MDLLSGNKVNIGQQPFFIFLTKIMGKCKGKCISVFFLERRSSRRQTWVKCEIIVLFVFLRKIQCPKYHRTYSRAKHFDGNMHNSTFLNIFWLMRANDRNPDGKVANNRTEKCGSEHYGFQDWLQHCIVVAVQMCMQNSFQRRRRRQRGLECCTSHLTVRMI